MKYSEDWKNTNPNFINVVLRALVVTIAIFGVPFMQTGRFEFGTFGAFFIIMFAVISITANGINNIGSIILSVLLIISGTYSDYLLQQRFLELWAVPTVPPYKLILFPLLCIIIIVLINHSYEEES